MSRPIGVLASDATADSLGRAVAERIAATGQRVLLHVAGSPSKSKLPKNIERAATPTDIGFDCEIVLS
ncbi:MAG: hypothetical protein ABL897_06965, partial [Hyphomicrobium sp.]